MPTSHLTFDSRQSELLSTLAALPFPAFLHCCADLLTALGYEDVRPVARKGKKGKNRSGGFDLAAWVRVGTSRRPVIAQVKQLAPDGRVQQRYLDEARGAALRVGATEALLLTTGQFSYVAQEQIERQHRAMRSGIPPSLPLQCFDGERLATLLLTHDIGIRREGNNYRVDASYFDALSTRCIQPTPGPQQHRPDWRRRLTGTADASARRVAPRSEPGATPTTQLSIHLWIPGTNQTGRAQ